jgi:hypothetical protein
MVFVKKHIRDSALDLLKAVAVIAMLVAHSENIFNNNKSQVLHVADTIGSTLAFTLFVFASGISSYYAYYLPEQPIKRKLSRILKRGLLIYCVYVLLNLLALYSLNKLADTTLIIQSLTFVTPQIYTEFLIPLIFLPFWAVLIIPLGKYFFRQIYVAILFSIGLYLLGMGLSTLTLPIELQSIAALFIGAKDVYRYPMIQYSAVFLIAMRFAHFLININSAKSYVRDIAQTCLILGLLLLSAIFIDSALPAQYSLFLRWPPGIGFVLIGILTAFLVYLVYYRFHNSAIIAKLTKIGEMILQIYVLHVSFMFIYRIFIDYKFNSVILAGSAMLCFIVFSIVLSKTLHDIIAELTNREGVAIKATYLSGIMSIVFLWLILGLIFVEAKTIKKFENPAVEMINGLEDQNRVPNIDVFMSRKWIIKNTKLPTSYTKSQLKINLDHQLDEGVFPMVNIDDGKSVKAYPSEKVDDYNYVFEIDATKFVPGDYEFQVIVGEEQATSLRQKFTISYPLFVVWSIDYEGDNVPDQVLNAIGAIGDKYKMPVTHMFNPRIYIASEISAERRRFMTNWVLDRYQHKGDEIGMHLHMHLDMMEAMDIIPKTDPRWGGRTNGHDVLTSAYDYNDFYAMLLWARDQFKANGLPKALSYRAGGWYIEEQQLQALQDVGFTIDTSGRTSYSWGSNNIKGPWTLKETTVPYHPSTKDQNKSTPEPLMSLWEFPNNGWDSTNNEINVLKKAYDLNYQGKFLDHAQTLTYLSHPTYFMQNDEKRMKELLDYIGQSKSVDDQGPVIYLTLQDSLKYWD